MNLGRGRIFRFTRVGAVAGFLALALLQPTSAAVSPASAAPAGASEAVVPSGRTQVAPGVSFEKIVNKKIPLRTYVLRVGTSSSASLDAVSAGPTLGYAASTTSMIKNHDGAIAGVNGDFLSFFRGGPAHPFADDGELAQTAPGRNASAMFGFGQAGSPGHLTTGSPSITFANTSVPASWPVSRWNPGTGFSKGNRPPDGEVYGFTAYGSGIASPPSDACSVRLFPVVGNARWADVAKTGVTRSYTVDQVACGSARMNLHGGVVLSATQTGTGAAEINAIAAGQTVDLTWSVPGWHGVTDVLGGEPIILNNEQIMVSASCNTYLCSRNARTGVGIAANGTVLIVVVDGYVNGSKGVTLYKFAALLKSLGAVNAINLDGDGSSTMIIHGKTVNHPGDPGRQVSSALAILPGADPDLHIDPAT